MLLLAPIHLYSSSGLLFVPYYCLCLDMYWGNWPVELPCVVCLRRRVTPTAMLAMGIAIVDLVTGETGLVNWRCYQRVAPARRPKIWFPTICPCVAQGHSVFT